MSSITGATPPGYDQIVYNAVSALATQSIQDDLGRQNDAIQQLAYDDGSSN